jgi:anti-sigma factor RsiW
MARHDDLLMRFHDGELSEAQARAVEERLRAKPEAATDLEAMNALGRALRERTQHAVERQSFDGFFERVERGARAARPLSLRERLGFRVREWFRPWAVWPAAAAAGVAILALVAVGMTNGNGGANDCQIESLEYSGGAGAVFLIPDDKGSGSTTVIWTNQNNSTEEQDDVESH